MVTYSSLRFAGQQRVIPVYGPPMNFQGKKTVRKNSTHCQGLAMPADEEAVIAALHFNSKLVKKIISQFKQYQPTGNGDYHRKKKLHISLILLLLVLMEETSSRC